MEKRRWEESEERKDDKKNPRREKIRRRKMQARGKVDKSRNTVFLQRFVAPDGRAVGSPSGEMRNQKLHALVARNRFGVEMLKKCTMLWHEVHFEVKMLKPHEGTTCSVHF